MLFKKSKMFLVISNHRSGSSATAGVVHLLGVHMGDRLLGAYPSNPKGHFENIEFVTLNDRILDSVGATWANPPYQEKILSSSLPKSEINSFLHRQIRPIWGLKDPRITLTFDIWKPYLEEIADITYVFVWRSLEECAKSLASRNNFDLLTALSILGPKLRIDQKG